MHEQDRDPAESFDWEAIERTPDFQELVNGRRRFAWTFGTIGVGLGLLSGDLEQLVQSPERCEIDI